MHRAPYDDEPTIIDFELQAKFKEKPGHLEIGSIDEAKGAEFRYGARAFLFVVLTIAFTIGIVSFVTTNRSPSQVQRMAQAVQDHTSWW